MSPLVSHFWFTYVPCNFTFLTRKRKRKVCLLVTVTDFREWWKNHCNSYYLSFYLSLKPLSFSFFVCFPSKTWCHHHQLHLICFNYHNPPLNNYNPFSTHFSALPIFTIIQSLNSFRSSILVLKTISFFGKHYAYFIYHF